jgi:hypothetical protein
VDRSARVLTAEKRSFFFSFFFVQGLEKSFFARVCPSSVFLADVLS